jgi:peptide/nickel transport system substrate-binding protein
MTNTKKPPFDDVNFRKAVSQGIDRKVLADKVYYGMVDPCAIPAPSGGWWYSKKANDLNDFDLERAKAHLKQSKYPNGAEFELAVPAQPYLIDTKDAAVVIQSQLAQLNIHPKINLVDKPILDKMLLAGNHTSILWVWMSPGEPTYMIEMLYSRRGAQWGGSGWVNEEFEKTVQESLEETDQEKLKPIYDRMLTILAEESPHVWMGFVHAANLWRDNVKNFQVNQGLTMRVKETYKG